MIKRVLLVSLSLVMSLFAVEFGLLRGLDPWGANAYYNDLETLKTHYVADNARGYILPVGTYQLGHWSLTMTEQGRRVPDTAADKPIVALVGDSLVMGHGVNDSDTFANLLAQRFPDCTFRNLGLDGYNTAQVQAVVDSTTADHYLYFMVSNDAEPMLTVDQMHTGQDDIWQGLHRYWYHWLKTRPRAGVVMAENEPSLPTWFVQSYQAIVIRRDITIVGFAGERLTEAMNAVRIPYYTHAISYADPHPDASGHQQIANALNPIVAQWCGVIE
jgi:hypothetical protein